MVWTISSVFSSASCFGTPRTSKQSRREYCSALSSRSSCNFSYLCDSKRSALRNAFSSFRFFTSLLKDSYWLLRNSTDFSTSAISVLISFASTNTGFSFSSSRASIISFDAINKRLEYTTTYSKLVHTIGCVQAPKIRRQNDENSEIMTATKNSRHLASRPLTAFTMFLYHKIAIIPAIKLI